MTEHLRWGILGASRFARRCMVPALHAARGNRVAALATRDPARAAPFAAIVPDLRVHDGYDALLADPGVDAIYVPLPHTMHVEWAIRALDAGKHVLVEKPVAMTAPEIAPLIAARDRTGLVCAEAFMIVHHPQWLRVRDLIADGAIGRLAHVEGVFTYDNSGDPGNIRNAAATGGGALPHRGLHHRRHPLGHRGGARGGDRGRHRLAGGLRRDRAGVRTVPRLHRALGAFHADAARPDDDVPRRRRPDPPDRALQRRPLRRGPAGAARRRGPPCAELARARPIRAAGGGLRRGRARGGPVPLDAGGCARHPGGHRRDLCPGRGRPGA